MQSNEMTNKIFYKVKCETILKKYGIKSQIIQTSEEIGELLQAISKAQRNRTEQSIENLAQEIADVTVMLEQIKIYFSIGDRKIDTLMCEKIDRQLKRIRDDENKRN